MSIYEDKGSEYPIVIEHYDAFVKLSVPEAKELIKQLKKLVKEIGG